MNFHEIKIKHVNHITPKAVEITLDIPDSLQKDFQYTAGQYITFQFDLNNEKTKRAYSLCSAPFENEWKIGVKSVESGYISKHFKNNISTNSTILATTPNGRFGLTQTTTSITENIVCFAGGSGITPILSIVKESLEKTPNTKVYLFYANKDKEDTMFLNEIEALTEKYENLKTEFIFENEKSENAFNNGRIDNEKIDFILNNIIELNNIDASYICGPEKMLVSIANTLFGKGLEKSKINIELFTTPSLPLFVAENDSNQITETVSKTKNFTIEITLDEEKETITIDNNQQTILDNLLDEGIDAPYSCKGGVCSSCTGKIVSGEVDFDKSKNLILTDGEIEEGYVLCCQSKQVSQHVEIDFDDVP